jgi:glycosyltransferase involved in cell wall biosynthesis
MAASVPRILVLEPYYGGSHQTFLEGLQRSLPLAFELLTLPARGWKWRMRLAAPYFADKLRDSTTFTAVLCSTFVDVAALRGLGPAWLRQVPVLTYFHENQFAYPVQAEDERDLHFGLTNLTSALASDRLAFNSAYNRDTFLQGAARLGRLGCDFHLPAWRERILARSEVLPPGCDFSEIDAEERRAAARVPVIVWNHRWEHDKDPETFFRTLYRLDQEKTDFQLIVLGQSFRQRPEIFREAAAKLAHRILHFGYLSSRSSYLHWLRKADLVISTAHHEFFGLAVIEAVRAGCRPLLPNRLSYPELFPAEFLYADEELLPRLRQELLAFRPLPAGRARELTDRFSWSILAPRYQKWLLAETAAKKQSPCGRIDFSAN